MENYIDDINNFLKSTLDNLNVSLNLKFLNNSTTNFDSIVMLNKNRLLLDFKSEIYPNIVLNAITKYQTTKEEKDLMLIGNYISPSAKSLLKNNGLNYLDKAGNIYLKLPNIFIHVEGNKNESLLKTYRSRAFTKNGAIVLFQFLKDPNMVNATYRKIAEYSNVSLGTIPKVFEGLKKEGFLIRIDDKRFKLNKYEILLSKWVDIVNEKILPSMFIQNYSLSNIKLKKLMTKGFFKGDVQWGGEVAAALLTGYLNPEKYCLFTNNKQELIKKYKLLPSQNGEIQVYHSFWKHMGNENSTADPLVIYAQLIGSGDSRNIETAKRIYDEYIKNKL